MAGHLVLPVRDANPSDLLEGLRAAHDYLVMAARATVPRLLDLPSASWGAAAKREHVVLPLDGRPSLVSSDVEKHSFLEVVNQCATLERLIDTLSWTATKEELRGARLVRCNPTTSSAPRSKDAPREEVDHDLVLRDEASRRWRFEVSDVASSKDGNGKEKKDLISLGIWRAGDDEVPGWPDGRHFLVVSSEFAQRLQSPTRHGLRLGLFHYVPVKPDGETRILEVCQGPAPAEALPRGRRS